ncbi:MAG TPA: hypothetical protein VL179_09190 [Mycobacterium sp.]|nr:hypothetical protein [Mycobacterium sp.]
MVKGIELRYLLTTYLFDHGHANVAELVAALIGQGFATAGRPSKAVSDALRWERQRSRVRKFGRGQYGPGWIPRGTEHRMYQRVQALRDEVASTAHSRGVAESRAPTPARHCGTREAG